MATSTFDKVCVREQDAIRLILEFLSRRDLCISQLALERESGTDNCHFNDDLIFLRQLILDGQWNDVLQFVSPLESIETFSQQAFRFIVYKHQYVELLCIRSEAASPYQTVEVAVEDIIECLNQLDKYCPDRETYNRLSSLLTIPSLADDEELKNWNPNSWRLKCFTDIRPLVERFMQPDREQRRNQIAENDRLMVLIFKGLMYEVCLNTIKRTLTKNEDGCEPDVMNGVEENYNLNSFLQTLPASLLTSYFSDASSGGDFRMDIEKHDKPHLVASWSEMILSTPIKPQVFPHTVVPYTRIKAADLMSKSLTASLMQNASAKDLMTMSVCDIAQFSRSTLAATGFHLEKGEENPNQACDQMEASVDRLFLGQDVFNSSRCASQMPTIEEQPNGPSEDSTAETARRHLAGEEKSDAASGNPMNDSYIDIWLNYQREKEKLLTMINGATTSGSIRSAHKNRQESSRFRQRSNNNNNLATPVKSNCEQGRQPMTSTPKVRTMWPKRDSIEDEQHVLWTNSPISRTSSAGRANLDQKVSVRVGE